MAPSAFFRALRAKEILIRSEEIEKAPILKEEGGKKKQTGTKYFLPLLLYKDARADQNLLDRTCGPLGWKREHKVEGGKTFCRVSLKDPATGEWIAKEDVGSAGGFERDKSLASDSFKRACSCWGIGRELYTVPSSFGIAFEEKEGEDPPFRIERDEEGRLFCPDRFFVKEVAFNSLKELIRIVFRNADTGGEFERDFPHRDQTPWSDTQVKNPWTEKKNEELNKEEEL